MKFLSLLLIGLAALIAALLHLTGAENGLVAGVSIPVAILGALFLGVADFSLFSALTFALLPFVGAVVLPRFYFVTPNLYSVAVIFLLVLSLFSVLFGKRKFKITASFICISGYILLLLIHMLFSPDPLAPGRLLFTVIFVPFITLCAAVIHGYHKKTFELVLRYYTFSAAILSIFALYFAIATGSRAAPFGVPSISTASLIIPAFFIAYINRNMFSKKTRLVFLCLTVAGLLTTMPRVYLLFVLLTPVIKKIIEQKHSVILFMFIHILSLVLTMSLFGFAKTYRITGQERDHIREIGNTWDRVTDLTYLLNSIAGRFYEFEIAINDFYEHPFVGIGIATGQTVVTPHNYHFEILQFSGILGYLLFSMFLFFYFKKINPYLNKDQNLLACALTVFAVLTNSITNGIMHGYMPLVMFFIFGLSIGHAKYLEKESLKAEADLAEKA